MLNVFEELFLLEIKSSNKSNRMKIKLIKGLIK